MLSKAATTESGGESRPGSRTPSLSGWTRWSTEGCGSRSCSAAWRRWRGWMRSRRTRGQVTRTSPEIGLAQRPCGGAGQRSGPSAGSKSRRRRRATQRLPQIAAAVSSGASVGSEWASPGLEPVTVCLQTRPGLRTRGETHPESGSVHRRSDDSLPSLSRSWSLSGPASVAGQGHRCRVAVQGCCQPRAMPDPCLIR